MHEMEILNEREKTHGDFIHVAEFAQGLKQEMRCSAGWELMRGRQREALDLIATKIGRILFGRPGEADHWRDIAGYAELAAECCEQPAEEGDF